MAIANIKKFEMAGKEYKVVKVNGNDVTTLSNGIISHMSAKFVENELANGRAVVTA